MTLQKRTDIGHSTIELPIYILKKPFLIYGEYAKGEIYNVPLATLETPVVSTVNRGRKIAYLSGGINTKIRKDEMTRAPVICTNSHELATRMKQYMDSNFGILKEVADSTTRYGKTTSIETIVSRQYVFFRLGMFTADAAGHNMTEKGAVAICEHLKERFSIGKDKIRVVSLSSNMEMDKKPGKINKTKGRGKSVRSEVVIPYDVLQNNLRTSASAMLELNYIKNEIGSKMAGSISRNAHHANMVEALFNATGQDTANVVEGSIGDTIVERRDDGIYFAVDIPALIVGTVSSSFKRHDYIKKNLEALGCYGSGNPPGSNSRRLAEIIASVVLTGELSLMAALTNEYELWEAHDKEERGNKIKI